MYDTMIANHVEATFLIYAEEAIQEIQNLLEDASHVIRQEVTLSADLESPYPDAILISKLETLNTAKELWLEKPFAKRPLIVYLTSDASMMTRSEIWADAILQIDDPHLKRQLQSLLKLQRENIKLAKQIDTQNRVTAEVEILKNAIVRNVSHELKTPLLQVKSAVALLAEDVKNEKLITYAKGATARLETLVKNITLLGSSLDYSPGPVIIRDALEHAKRNLGRIWEHRDAGDRIKIELGEGIPPVQADKQGLNTVLQLLIDNGLKFSTDDIVITAHHEGNQVEIQVADEGIGIDLKEQELIFETFYQVDLSSTRRYGGTGIGLAIAQFILDNHESKIRVSSEIGKGSTFAFTLPVVSII